MQEHSHGNRPVTIHELKLQEQYVPMILDKSMTYQVRRGDRAYQDGHLIRFSVVDIYGGEVGKCPKHDGAGELFSYCTMDEVSSIENTLYEISGVMSFPWLEAGYVVFSIAPARKSATSKL